MAKIKHLLLTTIAAVVLVGCGTTQQVTVQAPDISIQDAAREGNIKAIKQHIAAGTDVNAKGDGESTPLHWAAYGGHKETAELLIAELLIAEGADVNAGWRNIHQQLVGIDVVLPENPLDHLRITPLDVAIMRSARPIADLLRKHGGKTGEELKAEGN
jgi:ankyrin repeat protein